MKKIFFLFVFLICLSSCTSVDRKLVTNCFEDRSDFIQVGKGEDCEFKSDM